MAVPLEKFVQQLAESGILAGETLKDFIPPKASPRDATDLARELVRQKKLTRFQAEEVSKGKGKSLVLGNYVLMEQIGAGGMGQVFKAEHRRMRRSVAVKVLPAQTMKDPATVARFEREVTAAARISHPNIVAAYDADCANEIHFLVMELVEGSDLSAVVKKNGPFSIGKAVNYILQAARGLEAAHAEGIVHRDIKPANLLLDKKGTVKILDMGLARIQGDAAGQAELTGTGAIMGTVDYMAPEQALSTKHADARADIYSLGCTLYYLLTAKATYDGDTLMAKLLAHRDQAIPDLRTDRPEVSVQLETVFKKMVAKKADDRFQTMTEVIAALERCAAGQEQSTTTSRISLGPQAETDLTSFLEEISSTPTIAARNEAMPRALPARNNKMLLFLGGGLLGALVLLAGLIVKLKTKDGTLMVTVNEPDAEVQVLDGEGKIEITRKGDGGPVTISVDPGKHRLKVRKDGFEIFGKDFEIASGGKESITARLVPVAEQAPVAEAGKPAATQPPAATAEAPRAVAQAVAWQDLFDGKSLTGWTGDVGIVGVENGILVSDGKRGIVTAPGDYQDAEINVEFRLANGGNSGLGICYSGNGDPSIEGLEVQMLDDDAFAGIQNTQKCGSLFRVAPTTPGHFKRWPEWNQMRVTTSATDVQVELNGVIVLDATRTEMRRRNPQHTGVSRTSGKVCLFPITGRSEYRNFRIRPMQQALAGRRASTAFAQNAPDFQKWVRDVAALPAEKQLEAVSSKLVELNPRFDGKLSGWFWKGNPKIENGVVTLLGLQTDHVTDLSPLRALTGLKTLGCSGSTATSSQLSDLSPLQGMPLKELYCMLTKVSDLTPLKGMPLTMLICHQTQVADLSPLETCRTLKTLRVEKTRVTPASVAALQKALPDCQIVWDDPETTGTQQTAPIDLIALIDPSKSFLRGAWSVSGKALLSPSVTDNSLLEIPYDLPQRYRLDLVAERTSDVGFGMNIFFASAGNQGTIVLEGSSLRLCALEMIDGKSCREFEPAYRTPIFSSGQPTSLRVTVLDDSITVLADGKTVIDWKGNFSRFSIHPTWPVPKANHLLIGTQTGMTIHSMTLTSVAANAIDVPAPPK